MRNTFKWFVLAVMGAASGCGSSSGSNGGGGVLPEIGAQYVYVMNRGDDYINQFRIGDKGALVPLSPPTVATGDGPSSMVMDQAKTHLYVANIYGQTISQFRVTLDGTLVPIAAPIDGGDYPQAVVLSPDGRFLYAMNTSANSFTQFTVGQDGALTKGRVTQTDYPMNMAFSPSGLFAYFITGDLSVGQYSYLSSSGDFTPLSPPTVTAQACPTGPIAVTKTGGNGEYLYLLSCADHVVEVFHIDTEDGGLTSQGTVATGQSPQGLFVRGNTMYVANGAESTISIFNIGLNGGLSLMTTEPVSAALSPETLALDASGEYAYVLEYAGTEVYQYDVSSSGTFTPMAVPFVTVGNNPIQILIKQATF